MSLGRHPSTRPVHVVVTGASGFIGRALIDRLVTEPNVEVTAFMRRESTLPPEVRVYHAELTPTVDLSKGLRGSHTVIHLAARVHVMRDYSTDPLTEYRETNVDATLSLARQAASAGVSRFIFLSTVKVNGEATQPGHCFEESDTPEPQDPYAVSKMEAERGLLTLRESNEMEIVVIRPPLVYGPGVKANFRQLARLVSSGIPIPLGAVRNNRRSLINLDNLTDLIVTCMRHEQAANQIFLASDGEDLATADLVKRMAQAIGVRARLFPVPIPILKLAAGLIGQKPLVSRLSDSLQVSIKKVQQVLEWNPPVSVDMGLKTALAEFRMKTGSRETAH